MVYHLLISMVALHFINIVAGTTQKCPSDAYTYCADDGTTTICKLPPDSVEGYISYGGQSKWVLLPFSKTKGWMMHLGCRATAFGDINPTVTKYCCFIEETIGFPTTGYTLGRASVADGVIVSVKDDRSNANAATSFQNYNLYYPHEGSQHVQTSPWKANHDTTTNDPISAYYTSTEIPTSISASHWTVCGGEDQNCEGLRAGHSHWVKFGSQGKYYYKLVITDGTVPCSFGGLNPNLDVDKYCYYSEPQFSFSNIQGAWKNVYACIGCGEFAQTITVGVNHVNERGKEIETSAMQSDTSEHSWSASLTVSMEAWFVSAEASASYGGGVSMTSEQARSETQSVMDTVENSQETELHVVCTEGVLWQYTMSITQTSGDNQKTFDIGRKEYVCLGPGKEPKCPPELCADNYCQEPCASASEAAPFILGSPLESPQGSISKWFNDIGKMNLFMQCLMILSVFTSLTAIICVIKMKFNKKRLDHHWISNDCDSDDDDKDNLNHI